jgi:DUF2934 family protein
MFVPSKSKKSKSKMANAQNSVPNGAVLNGLKAFQPLPSHEQISQRAYSIYQNGGSANGHDQQDWLRAEQEMFAARKHQ